VIDSPLGESYYTKARKRLRALAVLFEDQAYSDVVREAQEIVELALKGVLRKIGLEPPKLHDVGPLVVEYQDRLPTDVAAQARRLAEISHWLRREREVSFYGDVDLVPTEEHAEEDASRALADARSVVEAVRSMSAPSDSAPAT